VLPIGNKGGSPATVGGKTGRMCIAMRIWRIPVRGRERANWHTADAQLPA
jgi:hypothetical protein